MQRIGMPERCCCFCIRCAQDLGTATILATVLLAFASVARASDGFFDATWGGGTGYVDFHLRLPGGALSTNSSPTAAVPLGDGGVIVAGLAFNMHGNLDFTISRLLPDLCTDSTIGDSRTRLIAFDVSAPHLDGRFRIERIQLWFRTDQTPS